MQLKRSDTHRPVASGAGGTGTPAQGSKGGSAGEPQYPPPQVPSVPSMPAPQPPEPPRRRSPGITAGVVLIVIGGVFLLGQVVPGLAWWTMWPLIVVVAGVVQAFTPGREGWSVDRMFDGFVTVAVGLVLLAMTTGVVGFSVVWQILSLWPVLLIAIGLDLLGKALHTTWVRALGSVAVIAALAYSVAVTASGVQGFQFTSTQPSETRTVSEPVGSVTDAKLELKAGAAAITLDGGQDLVRAEASGAWGAPQLDVQRSGSSAQVDLSLGETDDVVVWPQDANTRLETEVSRSVTWDMLVETGVSSLDADLSDVPVRSIELKPGVADCRVTLGDVPDAVDEATAKVEAGISSVVLRIPRGVEARVESESGLTGHAIDADLEPQGSQVWETSDFDEARAAGRGVWLISVKSGIGSIQVDTY